MKNTLLLLILFTLTVGTADAQKLKKIFNGKNLNGWHLSQQDGTWEVNKGILNIISGEARKGAILWTDKHYGNFVFQCDYKNGEGTIDSGIFLRSEVDQIQIGISGSLKRDLTGSPYIPGKRYPVEAKNVDKVLSNSDWNTMKIKCIDNTYTVWLNGTEVMTYTSENMPKSGPIGIQLHPGNTMSIAYKNIKIAEI